MEAKAIRVWGSIDLEFPVQRSSLAQSAFDAVGDAVRECYSEIGTALNAESEYMTLLVEGYEVWRKRFLVPRVKEALLRRRLQRHWDRMVGDPCLRLTHGSQVGGVTILPLPL